VAFLAYYKKVRGVIIKGAVVFVVDGHVVIRFVTLFDVAYLTLPASLVLDGFRDDRPLHRVNKGARH